MKLLPFFLILLITPVSGLLIVEVYPNPFAKNDETEFVKIYNPENISVNLSGWVITDFESSLYLKGELPPKSHLIFARNGTSFRESFGEFPDYEWKNSSKTPDVEGDLRLSNAGDEVALYNPEGALVDLVVYGESWDGEGWRGAGISSFWEGVILKRARINGEYVDTNSAKDWNVPRIYVEGQTDLKIQKFMVNRIQIISFPVSNWSFVSGSESVRISSYLFENPELGSILSELGKKGVKVEILVEGSPAGGLKDDVLKSMKFARIYLHESKAYRFMHAKYGIIDNSTVIVLTENWKNGNKGYGVILYSPDLARYFSYVFEMDKKQSTLLLPSSHPELHNNGRENRFITLTTDVTVIPVFSPDTSWLIPNVASSARERLLVEMPYMQLFKDGKISPFLQSIIDSAENGAKVRILLDGSPYNTRKSRFENDDAVKYLNKLAKEKGYDLKAKLYNGGELHSKMFIADETVYIGSMNWNENGLLRNREAGVLITDPEFSATMENFFFSDWNEKGIPFITSIPPAVLLISLIIFLKRKLEKTNI